MRGGSGHRDHGSAYRRTQVVSRAGALGR
jgi:hypothetical protein